MGCAGPWGVTGVCACVGGEKTLIVEDNGITLSEREREAKVDGESREKKPGYFTSPNVSLPKPIRILPNAKSAPLS